MALTVSDISFRFSQRETLLCDVSIEVGDGEMVALVGPSGSGKSTLLHCIAGLLTPEAGNILVDGKDVTTVQPSGRGIGIMMQDQPLYEHMTVEQNIAFPLRARGKKDTVYELVEQLELASIAKKKVSMCSVGERKRVAFGRAIVCKPRVLLLDEPFTSVQKELQNILQEAVSRLGASTLLVTHAYQHPDTALRVIHMEKLC